MNSVGIIAEFNPLHNGHLALLDYARNVLSADAVVVAMSGDFVQRGEPAILDKFTRAGLAVKYGADLVIELFPGNVISSAQGFSECGVALLDAIGCENLLFGAESDDLNLFRQASLSENNTGATISEDKSLPYAGRRAEFLKSLLINGGASPETAGKFLKGPNNILGIEYMSAINRMGIKMKPLIMKREGSAEHNSTQLSDGLYTSASSIRASLLAAETRDTALSGKISSCLPQAAQDAIKYAAEKKLLLFNNDMDHPMAVALTKASKPDRMPKDLYNRIISKKDAYTGIESFADLVKTKNFSRTQIMRGLYSILLQKICCEDLYSFRPGDEIPYIRVLSASKNGMSLLKEKNSPCPVINPMRDRDRLNERSRLILDQSLIISDFVRMARQTKSKSILTPESRRFFHAIS
jgi:predicted nucleotidyltransferase